MFKEIFRFFLGITLMLTVSGLLAFNAMLFWVASGERSIDALTPYIESALSSSDGSYEVKIRKTRLIWDGWKHPVDIRLDHVSVLNSAGKKFTSFPEIALGVDVLYLPLGKIMPTSLTIDSPHMNLVQYDDLTFGFSFKQELAETEEAAPPVPFSTIIAKFSSDTAEGNLRRMRNITIKDASLTMRNTQKEVFFDASDFKLSLTRNRRGEILIASTANISYKDKLSGENFNSTLSTDLSLTPGNNEIDGLTEFSELRPDILANLFTEVPLARSFTAPISGKTSFSINESGILQSLEFDITSGSGTITTDKLPAPLTLNSLQLTGAIGNSLSEIRLDKLNADIDGISIAAKGHGQTFDTTTDPTATPEISGTIVIKNAPAEKIKNFWPPSLSPMTREWVTENITEGKITENTVVLNIKKYDLSKPILPREAIDATINVEGLKIRYLPEHPAVTKARGKIHIDGISLDADIQSGDFLERTRLSSGQVTIDDLNVDNPYINVSVHAESPAKDMVRFLALPRLKHSARLGLEEATASGMVKGDAKIGFNFFAPEGKTAEEAIIYNVNAELENVSQRNFLHKFDILAANGNIKLDNVGLLFEGSGEVNGAKVSKGNVRYLFAPESDYDTLMDVTATTSVENLERFGYPQFPFLKGALGVTAKVKLGTNLEQNEAKLDLTNTDINFSKILSWRKPAGEEARLDLTAEKKDTGLKINSFTFSGKKISGKGSAALSKDLRDFTLIKLADLKMGDNDISSLSYEVADTGSMNISVTASSFDMSDHMAKSTDGFSFQNFPAMQLKANIGKLFLSKDRTVNQFKGEVNCTKLLCPGVDIAGETGEAQPFTFKIVSYPQGPRQLAITSTDAGSFLRAFSVLDSMSGGKLNINGVYQPDGSLKGKLDVSEHSIKDAPILGKILSLASLTGFIDALQGNGISFRNMNMPFTLKNDVITIENGKTYGSAIGITMDGTITFPRKTLDINGTVVPSYTLNNFFGKVPLLGGILTGGEGQGIFAARYSIKGPTDNADVSVNPLSILTPGFLRGLFDIFDDNSKPEEKPTKGKSKKYEYPG